LIDYIDLQLQPIIMADFESVAAMINQMKAEMKFHQGSLATKMDSNKERTVVGLETKMDVNQVKTVGGQPRKDGGSDQKRARIN
jgi:hypothetical protein